MKRKPEEELPLLPAQRAFVIQFSVETEVQQNRFAGRIEHMMSGQATHFHSVEELLAFIAGMLGQAKWTH